AVHRAADSMERHVAVVEALADSLPPLTESVTRLTDQLSSLMQITAPVAAAEREVSRLERLFGRRHGPASPMVHERPVAPPAQDASPGGEGVPPPPPPPRQA